ncbi:MAG TPA: aspartate--tRNA(Asn) ligase [Patescibacteria group bacterium]|nr:aspartate--tRNA(Asn) ligase [Patescibacteria group bacterium]
MVKRTLIAQIPQNVEKPVLIQGWVRLRRDHGKLIFLDIRDRSGTIQVVINPKASEAAYEASQALRPEDVVEIEGKVNKRPEGTINKDLTTGGVEVEAHSLKTLSKAETLPFDMGESELKLELPTLLDHRSLTLRHPKIQAIFKVQNVVIDAFRRFMQENNFFEFQSPLIIPAVPEGGADVFEVNYFNHKAYLAQSPQLYKQILVGSFERVFTVTKIFRAEPSVTTRHLAEIVVLDAEMGFIESYKDVQKMAADTISFILKEVSEKCKDELRMYEAKIPQVAKEIPSLKLREAQEIIFKRTGRDNRNEKDLNPEDEREIWKWALEEKESDLVFISHYPTKSRPFYTYPDDENPEFNQGFDLLGKGVEWLTGGRRVNDYKTLVEHAKEWSIDTKKIQLYLDAFKYGMPPEGGFSFGVERIVMNILGLSNVREASLFPRDMERVDERFSRV